MIYLNKIKFYFYNIPIFAYDDASFNTLFYANLIYLINMTYDC